MRTSIRQSGQREYNGQTGIQGEPGCPASIKGKRRQTIERQGQKDQSKKLYIVGGQSRIDRVQAVGHHQPHNEDHGEHQQQISTEGGSDILALFLAAGNGGKEESGSPQKGQNAEDQLRLSGETVNGILQHGIRISRGFHLSQKVVHSKSLEQICQTGERYQQNTGYRKEQEAGIVRGESGGECGTVSGVLGELSGQNCQRGSQQYEADDQRKSRKIAGNRQTGGGFKAGSVLEQAQHEGRGTACNGNERDQKYLSTIS